MKIINFKNNQPNSLDEFNEFLESFLNSKNNIVITGAGISTNSGIPVYLYNKRILDRKMVLFFSRKTISIFV